MSDKAYTLTGESVARIQESLRVVNAMRNAPETAFARNARIWHLVRRTGDLSQDLTVGLGRGEILLPGPAGGAIASGEVYLRETSGAYAAVADGGHVNGIPVFTLIRPDLIYARLIGADFLTDDFPKYVWAPTAGRGGGVPASLEPSRYPVYGDNGTVFTLPRNAYITQGGGGEASASVEKAQASGDLPDRYKVRTKNVNHGVLRLTVDGTPVYVQWAYESSDTTVAGRIEEAIADQAGVAAVVDTDILAPGVFTISFPDLSELPTLTASAAELVGTLFYRVVSADKPENPREPFLALLTDRGSDGHVQYKIAYSWENGDLNKSGSVPGYGSITKTRSTDGVSVTEQYVVEIHAIGGHYVLTIDGVDTATFACSTQPTISGWTVGSAEGLGDSVFRYGLTAPDLAEHDLSFGGDTVFLPRVAKNPAYTANSRGFDNANAELLALPCGVLLSHRSGIPVQPLVYTAQRAIGTAIHEKIVFWASSNKVDGSLVATVDGTDVTIGWDATAEDVEASLSDISPCTVTIGEAGGFTGFVVEFDDFEHHTIALNIAGLVSDETYWISWSNAPYVLNTLFGADLSQFPGHASAVPLVLALTSDGLKLMTKAEFLAG